MIYFAETIVTPTPTSTQAENNIATPTTTPRPSPTSAGTLGIHRITLWIIVLSISLILLL